MGPDAAALAAAARQAGRLRKDGNEYYRENRFGAAIDAYTEAITLCPNVPVYWTNRALCHRKRNDWQKVEEDSRKALQLDRDSVKGSIGVICKIVMLCFLLFCTLVSFSFCNSFMWNRKTMRVVSLTMVEARIALILAIAEKKRDILFPTR